jgi:hypothetical protein
MGTERDRDSEMLIEMDIVRLRERELGRQREGEREKDWERKRQGEKCHGEKKTANANSIYTIKWSFFLGCLFVLLKIERGKIPKNSNHFIHVCFFFITYNEGKLS